MRNQIYKLNYKETKSKIRDKLKNEKYNFAKEKIINEREREMSVVIGWPDKMRADPLDD